MRARSQGPDNRIKETIRETAKRVYAAPNKTRMDKKGVDYSYSFPLIFFNVEDYDSAWSDLVIGEGLHYCVRLFVRVRRTRAAFWAGHADAHCRRSCLRPSRARRAGRSPSSPAPSAGRT